MDPSELARGLFRLLETGDPELATAVVAPDNHNTEAVISPPACQLAGPPGALASSAWLRFAFPDLHFAIGDMLVDADRVWVRLRMRGRHTGPFVRFRDGRLDQAIPPTGREIDVEQIHLLWLRDGQMVRHEALQDVVTMLGQLGVFPPRPATMARMLLWRLTGQARRAAGEVTERAARAADLLTAPATGGAETGG